MGSRTVSRNMVGMVERTLERAREAADLRELAAVAEKVNGFVRLALHDVNCGDGE